MRGRQATEGGRERGSIKSAKGRRGKRWNELTSSKQNEGNRTARETAHNQYSEARLTY